MIDRIGEVPPDPGRDDSRARHAQPSWAQGPEEDTEKDTEEDTDEDPAEGPEDFRFAVRPYTWTRGRTRPVADLALETLVSTSEQGRDTSAICSAEHAAIAQLCSDVRSVAEVAALLALPLGVARVLLADMVDAGLVRVHRNLTEWGSAPGLAMMERVLAGLHQL